MSEYRTKIYFARKHKVRIKKYDETSRFRGRIITIEISDYNSEPYITLRIRNKTRGAVFFGIQKVEITNSPTADMALKYALLLAVENYYNNT